MSSLLNHRPDPWWSGDGDQTTGGSSTLQVEKLMFSQSLMGEM